MAYISVNTVYYLIKGNNNFSEVNISVKDKTVFVICEYSKCYNIGRIIFVSVISIVLLSFRRVTKYYV